VEEQIQRRRNAISREMEKERTQMGRKRQPLEGAFDPAYPATPSIPLVHVTN
jgi:hypothetical protein